MVLGFFAWTLFLPSRAVAQQEQEGLSPKQERGATEMKGRLSAASAGPGQGATFTIELPVQAFDAPFQPLPQRGWSIAERATLAVGWAF